MADTTDILKALKYWNAERFKTLQRKMTTAKNTIENEALSTQFKPFFTDEEVSALAEASRILGSVKNKIEHAKEIKAREEKARNLRLADYKRQRLSLLETVIPKPEGEQDSRNMLLWALALSIHHESISRSGYYYEHKYVSNDVERAFDTKNSVTVSGAGVSWWREVTEFLEKHLWHYDEAPDHGKLDAVHRNFIETWSGDVQSNQETQEILHRFDTQMTITNSDSIHRMGE
jgi:hypothetical protein